MPSSEVERQSHVMLDGLEITDKQGDRTCRDEQCVQQRSRMVDRTDIIDELLHELLCLVAKSLQPHDARVVGIAHNSMVERKKADVRRPTRHEVRRHQWLEPLSRTRLVSQNVKCHTGEQVTDRHIGPVGRLVGNSAKLLGEIESMSMLACIEVSEI